MPAGPGGGSRSAMSTQLRERPPVTPTEPTARTASPVACRLGSACPVGQAQAPTVTVSLAGGVDDERHSVALQARDFAEIENDVEIALGVDEVPQNGFDRQPPAWADGTVDGHDHRAAGPADAEARLGPERAPRMLIAACRDASSPIGPSAWADHPPCAEYRRQPLRT